MKKGMNPEAVEAVANSVDELIESIRSIYEGRLGHVTELNWTGEDRDQYISQFESEVGGANDTVIQQLTDFSDRLRRNVQHQRQTSTS